MAFISEKEELQIQEHLSRSTVDTVEQSVLYTTRNLFRYVEGTKHITGDCDIEAVEKSWRFYVPTIIWLIFAPQRFVLILPYPVSWDNEDAPLPNDQLQRVTRFEQVESTGRPQP